MSVDIQKIMVQMATRGDYASSCAIKDMTLMVSEIESLRAELAEHRSRIKMKDDMVKGDCVD